MKTKHRLLALLLSLCMILSLMPLGAMAAGEGGNVCTLAGSSNGEDNKAYTSFDAAFEASEKDTDGGCTITLTADCKNSVGKTIDAAQPLTIEGGGFTLTLADGVYFNVEGDLTINNITMTAAGNNDLFHVKSSKTITLTKCNLTANSPENGIFNLAGGFVVMNSGTLNATGFITNGGNGLSLKTGSGGVDILGGTIRLNKGAFITLLAGSTAPATPFKIQPSESTTETQNAAAGDVLLKGSASNVAIDAIAAKITVGDGKSWNVAKSGTDLVMHQLDNVKYVHAPLLGKANDGSLANPFTTLQEAYNALPEAGGEIRVLYNMTTETALDCSAAKAVTITSAYRFNNISLKPGIHSWTVTRGKALKDKTACTVSNGSVTLKNIVFDGGAKWGNEGLLARTNRRH